MVSVLTPSFSVMTRSHATNGLLSSHASPHHLEPLSAGDVNEPSQSFTVSGEGFTMAFFFVLCAGLSCQALYGVDILVYFDNGRTDQTLSYWN